MDSTPAPPSLQVYTSDALLLVTTLVSLTFRACRQGIDTSSADEDSRNAGRSDSVEVSSGAPSGGPRWADDPPRERLLQPRGDDFFSPAVAARAGEEGAGSARSSSSDADAAAALPTVLLPVHAASDPLLILAERLTLEEKLSTAVNWLSLVSNCLTYFLRPSQVLYTFLFTNGDFVLFVTSYSNRYQRLHPAAAPSLQPPPHRSAPLRHGTTAVAEAVPNSLAHSFGNERDNNARRLPTHHVSREASAVRAPPPSSRSPFPAHAWAGPRHRESALPHGAPNNAAIADMTSNTAGTYSPLYFKDQAFPLGRAIPRFRHYASRCVAFAQTQLSWLLFLNALLTSTLFVFHLHHLFFGLGTVFGYLAAVASVFLCGMELGCIVVRLRRWRRRRRRRDGYGGSSSSSSTGADDGGGTLAVGRDSSTQSPLATRGDVVDWDPSSGIHGPRWAFVGEHLSAAACSFLYVWMLLEEGDALWSSHVDLMRWYVCSCALMLLSLLKCLRAVS